MARLSSKIKRQDGLLHTKPAYAGFLFDRMENATVALRLLCLGSIGVRFYAAYGKRRARKLAKGKVGV